MSKIGYFLLGVGVGLLLCNMFGTFEPKTVAFVFLFGFFFLGIGAAIKLSAGAGNHPYDQEPPIDFGRRG